ncbi:MAG: GTP-binding protein [Parasporobacterium sp.]|nr:GTP-binding protein [Parasporobacterium sp.]
MKLLIVSGFLGAGKTTFISELIRHIRGRYVILENEFGNTDIDKQTLAADAGSNIWDLAEGCVCCSKSADLTASVITIENVLSPDYLIVEPSGAGVLSRLISNMKKIEYERITVLSPVTIVDGYGFTGSLAEFRELYEDQLRTAGTVLISKPDNPEPELRESVIRTVSALNPQADFPEQHYRLLDEEWWQMLLSRTESGIITGDTPADCVTGTESLETCTLTDTSVSSPANLVAILDNVVRGKYGHIVRAKGIIPAGSCRVRFDISGGIVSVTGIDEQGSADTEISGETGTAASHGPVDGGITGISASQCVFIGKNLSRLTLSRDLGVSLTENLRIRPRPGR